MEGDGIPDVTIVLGVYNAGPDLRCHIPRLREMLGARKRTFEIVAVEDGSSDRSLAVLREIAAEDGTVRVLRNPRNMGKGFSVRNGILNSRGRHVIFVDADMAYAMPNIAAVLDSLDRGTSITIGNRRLPESVYVANNRVIRFVYRRHLLGAAFNSLVRLLFGIQTRDTQSGLKGFQRDIAEQVFDRIYTDGFLFDIEVLIRAREIGADVVEIPVRVTYDTYDSTATHFRTFVRVLPDLFTIKLHQLRGDYRRSRAED